jgi:hypothetical protein
MFTTGDSWVTLSSPNSSSKMSGGGFRLGTHLVDFADVLSSEDGAGIMSIVLALWLVKAGKLSVCGGASKEDKKSSMLTVVDSCVTLLSSPNSSSMMSSGECFRFGTRTTEFAEELESLVRGLWRSEAGNGIGESVLSPVSEVGTGICTGACDESLTCFGTVALRFWWSEGIASVELADVYLNVSSLPTAVETTESGLIWSKMVRVGRFLFKKG